MPDTFPPSKAAPSRLRSFALLPAGYIGELERHQDWFQGSSERIYQLVTGWSDLTITSTICMFSLHPSRSQHQSLIFRGKQGRETSSPSPTSEDSFVVDDSRIEVDTKNRDPLLYTQPSTISELKSKVSETGSTADLELFNPEIEKLHVESQGRYKTPGLLEDAFERILENHTNIESGVHTLYALPSCFYIMLLTNVQGRPLTERSFHGGNGPDVSTHTIFT